MLRVALTRGHREVGWAERRRDRGRDPNPGQRPS